MACDKEKGRVSVPLGPLIRPALVTVVLCGMLLGSAAAAAVDAKPAPEYSARLLGSDQIVDLASLRGQVVLLTAWATWCLPCRKELPDFEAIHRSHGPRGLTVIGANINAGQADKRVQHYLESLGITFTNWRDPFNHFGQRFHVLGVPATFLLDQQGRIVHRWVGPMDPGAPKNLAVIEAVLRAGEAAKVQKGYEQLNSQESDQ